ncbi:hypothetical protein OFM39_29095, partial [Escherichia coli]|nr:hypothetical protein [Escherichia coli]
IFAPFSSPIAVSFSTFGCCRGEVLLTMEALGCEFDLFLSPALLVKKPKMLLDLSVFGETQNALGLFEKLDTCFSPSSSVFSLSFSFSWI